MFEVIFSNIEQTILFYLFFGGHMKKRILNLTNVLSYLLFLIFLCVLYSTSAVTEENTLLFNDNIMLTCWALFFLLALLSLINFIFHLVGYFRKRETEEYQEEEEKHLDEYKSRTKRYLPYFLLSLYKRKRDISFLSFHVLVFPLYATLLYFQKTMEQRLFYFYFVFLLGIVLLLILSYILFLSPLSEKKEQGKKDYVYQIYNDHISKTEEDKEEILYYSNIQIGKETKEYYLFLSRDNKEYIIEKGKIQPDTQLCLSTILKERKYDRLLTMKKQK